MGYRYDRAIKSKLSTISTLSALMILLAAILSGCGGNAHAGTQRIAAVGAPPPNLVSSEQLAAYPAGSAPRALLELWQAIQFSDVEAARGLVAPAALSGLPPNFFEAMVENIGDNVPGLHVLSTRATGRHASVRVYLMFYSHSGALASSSPATFRFQQGSHGYQLSSLAYFMRTEREILLAQRKASQR